MVHLYYLSIMADEQSRDKAHEIQDDLLRGLEETLLAST